MDRSFSEAKGQRDSGAERDFSKRYILVAGGSIGAGNIDRLIGMLLKHMERSGEKDRTGIIAICGNNQNLYWRLKRQYGRQIIVVGHTDYMANYLGISDMYITKPGGLSSTEAAVCGIPLLHMTPIPGCETFNAKYFREHGMSASCELSESGIEEVFRILEDGAVRTAMAVCQRQHVSKDAAEQICRLAERMVFGLEGQSVLSLRYRVGTGV